MRDTGFQVPADKLGRLASAYMMDPQKKELAFTVKNTGGSRVTVTKSKPPGLNVGFEALDSLQEGATIDPGATRTLHLQFAPQTPGSAADQWVINADGAQGILTVGLHGQGQTGSSGSSSSGCSTTGAAALWPLLALLPWAALRRRTQQS